jgi:GH15 family glucan-1,4-alpha-glucosidase
MLSEEYEAELGLALGNIPQAYSHLGLINAAVALSAGA